MVPKIPAIPVPALVDVAVSRLADVNEPTATQRHWPSWQYPHVPDGFALCMNCWQLISAQQLGVEACIPYGTNVEPHQSASPSGVMGTGAAAPVTARMKTTTAATRRR